jgi:hypothetical protein
VLKEFPIVIYVTSFFDSGNLFTDIFPHSSIHFAAWANTTTPPSCLLIIFSGEPEWPRLKSSHLKQKMWAGGMAQVVEHLPRSMGL